MPNLGEFFFVACVLFFCLFKLHKLTCSIILTFILIAKVFIQLKMFASEEVNWNENLSRSSTTLLSKQHIVVWNSVFSLSKWNFTPVFLNRMDRLKKFWAGPMMRWCGTRMQACGIYFNGRRPTVVECRSELWYNPQSTVYSTTMTTGQEKNLASEPPGGSLASSPLLER